MKTKLDEYFQKKETENDKLLRRLPIIFFLVPIVTIVIVAAIVAFILRPKGDEGLIWVAIIVLPFIWYGFLLGIFLNLFEFIRKDVVRSTLSFFAPTILSTLYKAFHVLRYEINESNPIFLVFNSFISHLFGHIPFLIVLLIFFLWFRNIVKTIVIKIVVVFTILLGVVLGVKAYNHTHYNPIHFEEGVAINGIN